MTTATINKKTVKRYIGLIDTAKGYGYNETNAVVPIGELDTVVDSLTALGYNVTYLDNIGTVNFIGREKTVTKQRILIDWRK